MSKAKKIIVFGNSGSGKSTFAKSISKRDSLSHLDLDLIAWKKTNPPERMEIKDSKEIIDKFLAENDQWIVEGCYSDLIELLIPESNQAIFMDLSIDDCIANAKNRPWEPHKYNSKSEQDANLSMLINWIKDYENREDTFSRKAHLEIFNQYTGDKVQFKSNVDSMNYTSM